jgi:HEAT repeat protein
MDADSSQGSVVMNDILLLPLLRAIDAADDEAAEEAVTTLSALDGPALPLLVTLSRSDDYDRRWWGVRAVAELAEEHPAQRALAMPALMDALNDPEDSIRCVAALALGQMQAASAIPALTLLLADPSGWVRGAAADALALIGEPAVPALGEALQDPREGVRVRAAYALRRIKSARSARWLFPALNDPNHIVHTYAYEALDEMGMLNTVLVM